MQLSFTALVLATATTLAIPTVASVIRYPTPSQLEPRQSWTFFDIKEDNCKSQCAVDCIQDSTYQSWTCAKTKKNLDPWPIYPGVRPPGPQDSQGSGASQSSQDSATSQNTQFTQNPQDSQALQDAQDSVL